MLPFERLRYLARYAGDDRELAIEAAQCLGEFGDDIPGLVTSCRRLLAHHVANGPLWWVCSRIVTAPDPADGARDAIAMLSKDRTAARLASTLPFPHDEPVAVVGWPETIASALAERPDLHVLSVRVASRHGARGRLGGAGPSVRPVDEIEAVALEPTHLLVEARAAGGTSAIVPAGTVDLLDSLPGAVLWLVAPVGTVLPERLFAVLARQLEDRDEVDAADADTELVALARAAQVAGPDGPQPPQALQHRVDCPVAPELLRF